MNFEEVVEEITILEDLQDIIKQYPNDQELGKLIRSLYGA
jgi:hypothetical protein